MSLFDELEKEMAVEDTEPSRAGTEALIAILCVCGIILAVAGTVRILIWLFWGSF